MGFPLKLPIMVAMANYDDDHFLVTQNFKKKQAYKDISHKDNHISEAHKDKLLSHTLTMEVKSHAL